MSEQPGEERFDLARFLLGYLEQAGSIVTPPAYGVYEVLMPDDLAASLQVEPYLRLSFNVDTDADAETLRLSVNHPLVETIAERMMEEAGHAQVFINHVRLDKRGLFEVAARTYRFWNARLFPKKGGQEREALHHYLRLNFKVAFISDEKQEQIVSVVMDVQGGHAVRDPDVLQRLGSSETRPGFPHLKTARPRWQGAGDALSVATFQALLPRAQAAVEEQIAGRLDTLQARMQRFLELDLARIEDYYAALEKDLQRRLDRLDSTEEDRRSDLAAKIEALQGERAAKLEDIRARYQLRVELELINAQVIAQPKLLLPVEISNRRTTITRFAVWDPLVHRLEPLICDVCGEPGEDLGLCTVGHLAHSQCMAPQCIDCKREYCQLCAQEVLACAVCHQPVCRASLITCPTCGRGICREHQELCHAADGQPVSLEDLQPTPEPEPAPPPPPPEPKPEPPSQPPAKRSIKHSGKGTKQRRSSAKKAAPSAKGVKIYVEIAEDVPHIVAYAMRSTRRVLAARTIELTSRGIYITCECEKDQCQADGWLYRPADSSLIQEQITDFLAALRKEYRIPPKRIEYVYIRGSNVRYSRRLILPPVWRDTRLLDDARRGFDRRRRR